MLLLNDKAGIGFAEKMIRTTFLLSSWGMIMAGCLVTDTIEFNEEANQPASLSSAAGAELELNRVSILETETPDPMGTVRELFFDVVVRDPNLQQILQAQIYADGRGRIQRLIPVSGEISRSLQFTIPLTDFVPNSSGGLEGSCHNVELWVSGEFVDERVPAEPSDVDFGIWWLAFVSDTQQEVDVSTCPD